MNGLRKLFPAMILSLSVLCLPLLAENVRSGESAPAPDPLALQTLRQDIFGPEPTLTLSCYASLTCWNGTVIQCSCPGGGVCTSDPTTPGSVSCNCNDPDPDSGAACPGDLCPPGASCVNDAQCGDGGACVNKRCLC